MTPDNRTAHRYTPLFCEENIWQLAQKWVAAGVNVESLQVIFISNLQKQVVLFNQRSGADLGYVVWDYHVILRRYDEGGDGVYDFDSLLPFPCNSREYFSATFGLQAELSESLQARLRIIPAVEYMQRLYSDRSHMYGVIDESKFPPWPAIISGQDQAVRLDEYWDMQRELPDGSRVLGVDAFLDTEL
jgi:hypothetical protein